MDADAIRKSINDAIGIEPDGDDRFVIYVPFQFDDGDGFTAILKRNAAGEWIISDETHNVFHLGVLDMGIDTVARRKIASDCLQAHFCTLGDGEISISVSNGRIGDALFGFMQGTARVAVTLKDEIRKN